MEQVESLSEGFARVVGKPESQGVSPLAQRLWQLNDDVPFAEMERIADRQGVKISKSTISEVANDRKGRLAADMITKLSKATGLSEREIADLDDQRWGIQRDYLARGPSQEDEEEMLANVATDKLLAEIAKRAGEGNPNR